jgi:hypothetical protein
VAAQSRSSRWDLHTHYYPQSYFRLIEEIGGAFSFGTSPTGQTIIRFRGARFFGITPPMTDPQKRLEDMDRVGIDVEVLSLSTPNVYFAPPERQAEVARLANDATPSSSPATRSASRASPRSRSTTPTPRCASSTARSASCACRASSSSRT